MRRPKPSATRYAPISTMKASASILMVGLRSMNRPSGVAASSITATASRIAQTMIQVWLAMPTAAITESSENTMSITAICAITIPNDVTALVWMSSDSASPTMASRISMLPFTSRNAPPRISTRSRTEMPWPNSVNRSAVSPASQASVSNRQMRLIQATAMPNLRAFSRVSTGSLLTAIEMNTRLSMPSTISIALRVIRVIQTSGSISISITVVSRFFYSVQLAMEDEPPGPHHVDHQYEHGGRTHVLGPAGQFVELGAIAFDHRLDRRVEQFNAQHQQHRADQQHAFHRGLAEPERQRCEQHEQVDLEAERGFVP